MPNPPPFVSAIVGDGVLLTTAIARAAIHDHLYMTQAGETALEILVERGVFRVHHEEQLDIRK